MTEKNILDQIIQRNSDKKKERKMAIYNANKRISVSYNLNKKNDDKHDSKTTEECENSISNNVVYFRKKSSLSIGVLGALKRKLSVWAC